MTAHAPPWTAEHTGNPVGETVLLAAIEQAELLCQRWPTRPGPPNISQRRTPSTATCALRPEPASVGAAREFATATLTDWRIAQLADDVNLVVSELVTNALRHALALDLDGQAGELTHTADPIHHSDPLPWVQLSLLATGAQLLCSVRDPSDQPPIRTQPDYIAQTGRGLHLVESFSLAWGWVPLRSRGKLVWALFPFPL